MSLPKAPRQSCRRPVIALQDIKRSDRGDKLWTIRVPKPTKTPSSHNIVSITSTPPQPNADAAHTGKTIQVYPCTICTSVCQGQVPNTRQKEIQHKFTSKISPSAPPIVAAGGRLCPSSRFLWARPKRTCATEIRSGICSGIRSGRVACERRRVSSTAVAS